MKVNMVTVKGNVDPLKLCDRVQKKSGRRTEVLSPLPKEEIKVEEAKQEKPEPVEIQVLLKVNMHCEGCAQRVKKSILKMRGVQTVHTDFTSHKVTVTGTMDPKKLVEYVHRRTGKYAQIVPPPLPQIEDGKKEAAEEVKKEEDKKEEDKKEEAKPEGGEKKGGEESGGEVKKEGEKVEGEVKKEGEKVEGEEKKEGGDQPVKEGEPEEQKKEGGEETVVVNSVEEKKNEVYAPKYVIEHVYPPQLFSDENPNACSIM